jgi:hypothetical protein
MKPDAGANSIPRPTSGQYSADLIISWNFWKHRVPVFPEAGINLTFMEKQQEGKNNKSCLVFESWQRSDLF